MSNPFGDILKKEQEALDRKDKDFAPWALKLVATPKKGLKITHQHKMNEALEKTLSSSKIELPSLPYPFLENCMGHYAFDLKKFEKQVQFDSYNADGIKNTIAGKWVWTTKDDKNVMSIFSRTEVDDVAGAKATLWNNVDYTLANQ